MLSVSVFLTCIFHFLALPLQALNDIAAFSALYCVITRLNTTFIYDDF